MAKFKVSFFIRREKHVVVEAPTAEQAIEDVRNGQVAGEYFAGSPDLYDDQEDETAEELE